MPGTPWAPGPDTRRFTLEVERGQTIVAIEVEVQGILPPWWTAALEQFQEVLNLPANWNSYGARQVTPQAVLAAIVLIDATMSFDSPTPIIVPTVQGGVQLEWHTRGVDLEVAVSPEGRYNVFYSNTAIGEEWEREYVSPPPELRRRLSSLA